MVRNYKIPQDSRWPHTIFFSNGVMCAIEIPKDMGIKEITIEYEDKNVQ